MLSENQKLHREFFFVFFTFMRRVNNLTCDFVPTSSMVIENKHKSFQSIITDN